MTIAEDVTEEELHEYGNKLGVYDEAETFGAVEKQQVTDQSSTSLKPEDKEKKVTTATELQKKTSELLKEVTT